VLKKYFSFLKFYCFYDKKKSFTGIVYLFGCFLNACLELLTILLLASFVLYIHGDLNVIEQKLVNNYSTIFEFFKTNIVLFIIIFFLIKTLYLFILELNKAKFISHLLKNFQERLSTKFFNTKYNFYKSINKPFFLKQVILIPERVFVGLMEGLFSIITELSTFILIIFCLIFFTGPYILLGAIFMSAVYSIVFLIFKKKIRKFSELYNISATKLFQGSEDFFNGFREILIFNKVLKFKESFNKQLKIFSRNWAFLRFALNYTKTFNEFIIILIIIVLLNFAKNNEILSIEVNLAFVTLLISIIRLYPNFTRIQNTFHLINVTIPQSSELKKFFDSLSNNQKEMPTINDKKKTDNIMSIKLQNISFDYNKNSILKNINIEFKSNKKYFIFGKSGSGKSTLLDIILGLNDGYSGKILFNNEKAEYQNIYKDGKTIGFIPQNKFLVNENLFNNITLFDDLNHKNIERVKLCLNEVDMNDFLDRNRLFNYKIGFNGNKLSSGQAQRVLLARILYFNPKIMVFDEPTSNLDGKTEKFFIENLINKSKDKIIIYVSHNLSYVSLFDEFFLMKNSKLKKIRKENLNNIKSLL
jgi:ABC-type multidrug transport system fused ATPase/permease subunit